MCDCESCGCADGVRQLDVPGEDGRRGTVAVNCTVCLLGVRRYCRELEQLQERLMRRIDKLEAIVDVLPDSEQPKRARRGIDAFAETRALAAQEEE